MGASLVYLNEPNKEIEHETGQNDLLSYVSGSMQGWRLNMEDSHVANVAYKGNNRQALFGVFDGHGGREVAVYCNRHYEEVLTRDIESKLSAKLTTQEWLRQSFLKVDEDLRTKKGKDELGDLRREKPPKKPAILNILGEATGKKPQEDQENEEMQLDSIGCTSNVVFIDHDEKKIYVANAGDSRCVLGKGGKAVEMSIDHKPESQTEIDRIEKSGSCITEGRVDGNLNLTRSLGDLKYKGREHLTPEEQAITANPDTYVFDLTDDCDFIIMGCDGIWEKKSNEEMVEWIYDQMKQQKSENGSETPVDLQQIVANLLLETIAPDVVSSGGVGCDNMTTVLIKFNNKK